MKSPQLKAFGFGPLGSVLALVLVWFAFIYRVSSTAYSFSIWGDNEYLLAPVLAQTSQILRDGEWPLWISSILGGFPIYNFTQLSVFYPFYGTIFPLFADPFASARNMHLITLAHMLIFLVNGFILLRTIKLGRAAAIAGSTMMVFNYNMLLYSGWVNIVAPYSWLPLFLAGVIRILNTPHSIRAFAMCLIAIVLLTTASPSQPLIHAVLLSGILVLAHVWRFRTPEYRLHLLSGVQKFVIVGLFAMAVCAPVILPAVVEYGGMIRWLGAASVLGHEKIPFEYFTVDQMALKDLPGVLFALKHSPAVGNPLIGLIPVLLARLACTRREHVEQAQRWLIWPLLTLAIYALLSACGSNSGLAYVNYHLPLINQIREPTRFLVLAHISVSILAAIGLAQVPSVARAMHDRKLLAIWQRKELRWLSVILLIGFLTAYFAPLNRSDGLKIWLPLSFGVLLLLVLWRGLPGLVWKRLDTKAVMLSAAALVVFSQFLLVPWRALPISEMDVVKTQKIELLNMIRRVAELDPSRQYRVIFEGDIDKQAAGMLASYYQVRNFNAYINPAPLSQFNAMYYHGRIAKNYHEAMGAKYLICAPCTKENTAGYTLLEQRGNYGLYQTNALPRFYFATQSSLEYGDLDDYMAKIGTVDLGKNPVLTSFSSWVSDPSAPVGSKACIQGEASFRHNRLRMSAQCSHTAILVVNEFDNGNWRATVNGVKARMLRVNYNQIGIVVGPGTTLIDVYYHPRIWRISLWLAVLALFSLLIYIGVWHSKRRISAIHSPLATIAAAP